MGTLQKQVKDLIDKGELSQAELAKKIDKSETTVSLWLKGKYAGNTASIDESVEKFLNFNTEMQQQSTKNEIPFVMTSVAKDIFTYAKLCQQDSEIGIIHGGSGLGKTTAIEEFAKINHGVIILEPDEDCGAKVLIAELYEKLGLSGQTKPILMKKEIQKKLNGSNFLVVIDEGENLKTPCFKALRKLHDKARSSFGLLFVGTHRLYHNLLRLKGDFEYLTNRIGYNFQLERLKEDDIKTITKTLINNDEIATLCWQKSNGNARILTKMIKRSIKLAAMNNVEVNPAIVETCRAMLIV